MLNSSRRRKAMILHYATERYLNNVVGEERPRINIRKRIRERKAVKRRAKKSK